MHGTCWPEVTHSRPSLLRRHQQELEAAEAQAAQREAAARAECEARLAEAKAAAERSREALRQELALKQEAWKGALADRWVAAWVTWQTGGWLRG